MPRDHTNQLVTHIVPVPWAAWGGRTIHFAHDLRCRGLLALVLRKGFQIQVALRAARLDGETLCSENKPTAAKGENSHPLLPLEFRAFQLMTLIVPLALVHSRMVVKVTSEKIVSMKAPSEKS